MALEDKEVLSQAEAWTMVGGRPVWTQLKLHYAALLIPIRVEGKKEQYLKEVIRTALKAAQIDGKLRSRSTKDAHVK